MRPARAPLLALAIVAGLAPLAGLAGIVFRQPVVEIAPPAGADDEIAAEFPFSNPGPGPAVVRKFNCACAGLTSEIDGNKLRYEPGETGVLRTRFKPGIFTGTMSKSIVVWMENDP